MNNVISAENDHFGTPKLPEKLKIWHRVTCHDLFNLTRGATDVPGPEKPKNSSFIENDPVNISVGGLNRKFT